MAKAIGWALLQFVWQGALVGALTAGVLACLRRGAADVRYVVSCLGLVVMITLPIATAIERAGELKDRHTDGSADDGDRVVVDGCRRAARHSALGQICRRRRPPAGRPRREASTSSRGCPLPFSSGLRA